MANIFQQQITPESPKNLDNNRIFVYVPLATVDDAGIANYYNLDFGVVNGKVYIKWPIADYNTKGLAQFEENDFTVDNGLVSIKWPDKTKVLVNNEFIDILEFTSDPQTQLDLQSGRITLLNSNLNELRTMLTDLQTALNTERIRAENAESTLSDRISANVLAIATKTNVKVNNVHRDEVNFSSDPQSQIDDLRARVNTMHGGISFVTLEQFEEWINGEYIRPDGIKPADMKVGSNVYIEDDEVPDYWCKNIPVTSINDFGPFESKQDYVRLSGNQVIDGIKQFNQAPVDAEGNQFVTTKILDKIKTIIGYSVNEDDIALYFEPYHFSDFDLSSSDERVVLSLAITREYLDVYHKLDKQILVSLMINGEQNYLGILNSKTGRELTIRDVINDMNMNSSTSYLFYLECFCFTTSIQTRLYTNLHASVVMLEYNGTNITYKGVQQTFNSIKALLDNPNYLVLLNDQTMNLIMRFDAYEEDAYWFSSSYKIDGKWWFDRLIINIDDEILHDDDQMATAPRLSATQTLLATGWQDNEQTISMTINTANRNVIDVLAESVKEWANCGILCVQETATSLKFTCDKVPTNDLKFKLFSEVVR